MSSQHSLSENKSPAAAWNRNVAKRAVDELFSLARQYRSSKAYSELLEFVTRFRFYSPFNAMLVHIQMPGATYVATPSRWLNEYRRRVKPGARPLVALRPMGPVMFVFDVSDTEPLDDASPLPPEVEHPFETRGRPVGPILRRTIENAKCDGIRVATQAAGAQHAGSIRATGHAGIVYAQVRWRPEPAYEQVPLRYELLLNVDHSDKTQYATVVHELAHLYCGHLGTPDSKWWPDRRGASRAVREFEAESVSFILCRRCGVDSPAAEYVASYVQKHEETPPISLDCVMKAARRIERMATERLKPRKRTR